MPKVMIIADDLTGANDSAVQFAERGFSVATLLTDSGGFIHGGFSLFDGVEVLSISTETRNIPATAAVSRVENLIPLVLAGFKPDVIFKKIDSTLRGNAGDEVQAVARILARRNATRQAPAIEVIVAPAYPSNGRTVRGGYLLVDGKPLSETYAARDVLAPVQSSYVPDYFTGVASQAGVTLRVADASEQRELDALVESGVTERARTLWVGSAGLAKALAGSLEPGGAMGATLSARADSADAKCPPRTLVLFGSMNPAAIAQVEALSGLKGCLHIAPRSPVDLPGAVDQAVSATESRVVVSSQRLRHAPNQPGAVISELVNAFFGEVAERAVRSQAFDDLVISGGDVAFAVLHRLGAAGISIQEEILPGVAFGSIIGGKAAGMGVVTKAGGFGDEGALKRILAHLDR